MMRRDICIVGRGSSTGVLLQVRVKRAAMRTVKVRAIRHGRRGGRPQWNCHRTRPEEEPQGRVHVFP